MYLRAWQARLDLNRGRIGQAGTLAQEVLKSPDATLPTRIVASVCAGLCAARTGDPERGRDLLDEASREAHGTGELQRLGPVAAAQAEAAWLARRLDVIEE